MGTYFELAKPFLSLICLLLAESQLYQFSVAFLCRCERDDMFCHITEIAMGIGIGTGTQTLQGNEKLQDEIRAKSRP